jgi:hypothetical protein
VKLRELPDAGLKTTQTAMSNRLDPPVALVRPRVGRGPRMWNMFQRRRIESAQAERDAEWRSLVRAVTEPGQVSSEGEDARLRAYLGDAAGPPGDDALLARRERITGPWRSGASTAHSARASSRSERAVRFR